MNREELQGIFNYLNEKYNEYYFANNNQKKIIENQVRTYAQNLDKELYLTLTEGSASGLFRHGFVETDLTQSLKILKSMIEG